MLESLMELRRITSIELQDAISVVGVEFSIEEGERRHSLQFYFYEGRNKNYSLIMKLLGIYSNYRTVTGRAVTLSKLDSPLHT
jgi:hypothetical protein